MKKKSVLLATFLSALCAPLVQGAIQISYDADGPGAGAPVVAGTCSTANPNPVSTGPVVCSIGAIPGVTISVVSTNSNSPGSSTAQQAGSTLFITTSAAATFDIYFSAQGFTTPTTPPNISYGSSLSTTSTLGSGSISLTSCVDTANGLTPPTNTFCGTPASTLTSTNSFSGVDSASDTDVTSIASLTTTPYALSQKISFSIAAGSAFNVITSQILTPVPEPASVMFLGTALIGVGSLLRKKLRRS